MGNFPPQEYTRYISVEGSPFDRDDLVLMQFTGLLDRNGKEIYEGDVVRFSYGKLPEDGVIEWHSDMFHIKSLKFPNLSPGNYRLQYLAPQSEVIGNIYENPELLSGK